jgi:polyphosphate kinase
MLEKAGCHVIYGLVGLKTHSKITLVVRREEDGIRRYVHLGTGNYNDSTAKLYTDLGMFTARESYGEDATAVFNMLSGYSEPPFWKRLVVAPLWMKDIFLKKINQCEEAAKSGKDVRIIAKMNSLSDKDIIGALYSASSAGVKIDLIVRGICCLRVGIKGVSENITVRSIVGTFLEHARIFDFRIDNDEEIFLGSADWMNRNLEKRVEIVFPVADEDIIKSIKHYLDVELEDNVKASILLPDDRYEKVKRTGSTKKNSQSIFIKEANQIYENECKINKLDTGRTFVPMKSE